MIDAFFAEFRNLTSFLERMEKIENITEYKVEEYASDARVYLTSDLLFRAKETGDMDSVAIALKMVSKNIEAQWIFW